MRRVIFIVGMHRSGAAEIAGALQSCGFTAAPALDADAAPEPVAALNRALMAMAGSRWDRLPATLDISTFAVRSVGDWAQEDALPLALAAWDAAFEGADGAGEGDLVVHDPHLPAMLPLWLRAAGAKGLAAEVLLVHRGALDLLARLEREDGLGFGAAAALVTDTWLEMLAHAPAGARVVSHEAFAAAPAATLEALGYPPASPEAARALDAGRAAPGAAPWGAASGAAPHPMGLPEARPEALPRLALPGPLRDLDTRLARAHGSAVEAGDPDVAAKRARRAADRAYAGDTIFLDAFRDVAGDPLPAPAVAPGGAPRTVVVHCHLFKNAGSSVDVILKRHFGRRWVTTEFPVHGTVSNADLTHAFVRGHGELDVLSTHTGDWWLGHDAPDLRVLPVIFLRHPLLRIRSAYSFERKQDADTFGARIAKTHDFAGYVAARLERPTDYAFREFQSRRLAAYHSRLHADLMSAALHALDRAPYVGLVEDFDGSARRLETYLAAHFEGFEAPSARANITDSSDMATEDRIARARHELGEAVYAALMAENRVDLEIYRRAVERWPLPVPAPPVHSAAQ
ncbi:hypothetical protein [Acuticoccus sediminis]|uniref:hypothetical protein n=1 Tax=Acuticoccus sediminis TaxID=2184697 RepID=UPI001CFDF019|nr:hypothetical protein [Acuticoccus sediminis]